MSSLLYLVFGLGAAVMVAAAVRNTNSIHSALRTSKVSKHYPKALGLLVLVVHAGEIVSVLDHVTIGHLVLALVLFALWAAMKTGTEEGLY